MNRLLNSFYFSRNFYYAGGIIGLCFILSYFVPFLYQAGIFLLIILGITVIIDLILVYGTAKGIEASRHMAERFSNGDENLVTIDLRNNYPFPIRLLIIDEIPPQFQERHWQRHVKLLAHQHELLQYLLEPKARGVYSFGNINLYAYSPLHFVKRRYIADAAIDVKVYPSFLQMRRYQLLAASDRMLDSGLKKVRRLGHSMEFEQIKEYVSGDDYRTINWKATARRNELMVNTYTDERSQQIYCIINKGRVMKMPFDGLTLLDYGINASLVLSNVAIQRHDKAGLICFDEKLDTFLLADRNPTQMNVLLETLYKQETRFLEADYERLFSVIRHRINHRSLLVLFTNFESLESLQREMPSLKRIAKYHLLLVIFFENTELAELTQKPAETTEEIYIKTIAEKFNYEKKQMVRELYKNGILAILTTPQMLTVNAINKYLELKKRQSI